LLANTSALSLSVIAVQYSYVCTRNCFRACGAALATGLCAAGTCPLHVAMACCMVVTTTCFMCIRALAQGPESARPVQTTW
jgi:hypothetical protein